MAWRPAVPKAGVAASPAMAPEAVVMILLWLVLSSRLVSLQR
jgi:hypothetical protein